jgi:LuxR family transcriptional regulator, maltose regulon positive regulatory protein
LTVAQVTPWLIDRGDLLAAVDRAAARKVTVISAPAGSGKTSLRRARAGDGRPGAVGAGRGPAARGSRW